VLIGLATFLFVIGVLGLTVLPGGLKKTPLDTNETTVLEGEAQVLNDDLSDLEPPAPVKAFKTDRVDSDASTDDVIVFVSATCLVHDVDEIDGCVDNDDPQARLITASTDNFATDRTTAESVKDPVPYLGEDAEAHEGLVNKWPFDAEKKAYNVWDDVIGTSVVAEYQDTATVDGLDVYVYESSTSVGPVEIAPTIEGSYYNVTQYYVEPTTGSIVNQVIHQERAIGGVQPALVLDLELTADEQSQKVGDAEDAISLLKLATVTVPIILLVAGGLLLVAGVLLLLRRRRTA
jgi:hypothetical protein